MLGELTIETFADRVGERFSLTTDEGVAPAELISVTALAAGETPARREPFSIVFLVPGSHVPPQGTYRFEHAALGSFELFVVPIGRDERGVSYEAVFN